MYHPGEREVQELAGESAIAERNGTVIAGVIPRGAIGFLAQQRMLVLGSIDADGSPWASAVFGPGGFVTSDSAGKQITINLTPQQLTAADILWPNVAIDPRVGMLAIELASRRRLRVNGTVVERSDTRLLIEVQEAYPNCPKYIQRRHLGNMLEVTAGKDTSAHLTDRLHDDLAGIVRSADTMFVASVNGSAGVDASHRGGEPGFVELIDGRTLRVPDYPGNSMFNTLGNIRLYPRAGLTFIDFDHHRVLQVTGHAEVQFAQPDPMNRTAGTGRFWTVQVEKARLWSLAVAPAWEFLDASPFNPPIQAPSQPAGAAS